MSATEHETMEETEGRESGLSDGATGERPLLVRAFGVHAELADENTVDVRIVPFDEVVTVSDPPEFRPYREQWMPGVFSNQERAANRILLRSEHSVDEATGKRISQLKAVIGHGVAIRSASDGYHGRFKFHKGPEVDLARTLVSEGVYEGVSAEFLPIRSVRTREGVVQRVKAHLDSVSFARQPAYSKAEILAMREETVIDEEMLPPPPSQDLLRRCEQLGISLPERMQGLLARAFTETAWDGSPSRWPTAAAYCASSAIDLNPAGKPKTKSLCHLPFKEPASGDVNVSAVRAALARIGQGFPQDATQAQRDEARAMLERLLNQFNSNQ